MTIKFNGAKFLMGLVFSTLVASMGISQTTTQNISGPDPKLGIKPVLLKGMLRRFDGAAPGGPGTEGSWQRPDKQGFLAVLGQDIRGTIAEGILSEVEYPEIDRAQTRDTQLLFVVNGNTFLEESKDFTNQVTRYPQSLAYHVSSQNQANQITIEKDIAVDPDLPVIVVDYDVTLNSPNTNIYVLHNPQADNTAGGDASFVSPVVGTTSEILSFQSDRRGDEPSCYAARTIQKLVLDRNATEYGTGYEGVNDPWTYISGKLTLGSYFTSAQMGNVASALGFPAQGTHVHFRIALAMNMEDPDGSTPNTLTSQANTALQSTTAALIAKQQTQWQAYLNQVNAVGRAQEVHMLVLKSLEDRNYLGSLVAGPSIPSLPGSINATETDYESARLRTSDENGGYRRVWIRDAFQMALGLLAGGDTQTPLDIARHFVQVQESSGNFPQNTWVDGTISWTGFQLDQTGYPIILVSRLVELGAANYSEFRSMVEKAGDAIVANGPQTGQERWEENGGLSPNSIAVACQGLMEASWLEQSVDQTRSQLYANTCTSWRNSLRQWTYIQNGPLGNGYFERIEVANPANPSHNSTIYISNSPVGGNAFPENSIIDGGFIQWLISGLALPTDPSFVSALSIYDQSDRETLSSGQGYYRYNHDGYGLGNVGQSWPLLSGERALAAIYAGADPTPYINVMMSDQTSGGMMSEQTGVSACPLGWAHAEVLIVNRSLSDKRSFYIPQHVTTYFNNNLN